MIDSLVVVLLIVVTFLGGRIARKSSSRLVRTGTALFFAFLVLAGWLLYGSAVERHLVIKNLASVIVPLLVLGVFLGWNRGLSPGVLIKYFSMPLGFYVSTLLMYEGSVQNSQADVINGMFPSIFAAFLSAVSLNAEERQILPGRVSWHWEATLFLVILSLIPLYLSNDHTLSVLTNTSGWIMTLGLVGILFVSLGKRDSEHATFLDAALYTALLMIALNTIMYMDLFSAYETEEQILRGEQFEATVAEVCPDNPEYSICEGMDEEALPESQVLWIRVSYLLTPLVYAIFVYLLGVLAAVTNNQTERLTRSNWHLAEGFVFVIFVYFAPYSLLSG
jgi:hypothetical protein